MTESEHIIVNLGHCQMFNKSGSVVRQSYCYQAMVENDHRPPEHSIGSTNQVKCRS